MGAGDPGSKEPLRLIADAWQLETLNTFDHDPMGEMFDMDEEHGLRPEPTIDLGPFDPDEEEPPAEQRHPR